MAMMSPSFSSRDMRATPVPARAPPTPTPQLLPTSTTW